MTDAGGCGAERKQVIAVTSGRWKLMLDAVMSAFLFRATRMILIGARDADPEIGLSEE